MLRLKIVSPEKIVFDGEVESVTVPGTAGMGHKRRPEALLVDHAPIISSLEVGTVSYVSQGERQSVEVKGGFVSVQKNVVNVCVEV